MAMKSSSPFQSLSCSLSSPPPLQVKCEGGTENKEFAAQEVANGLAEMVCCVKYDV